MHIAGMIENAHTQEVLENVKYFFCCDQKKVGITEYENRFRNRKTWQDYISALYQAEIETLIVKIQEEQLNEVLDNLPIDTANEYWQWQRVSEKIRQDKKNLYKHLMIILNSDVIKSPDFSDEKKCRLLCYGFNSNSKVTTSSTGEPSISGQFLCCIRERVISTNGKTVEPQEYVMNLDSLNMNPYDILAAASFAVLHDVDLNKVRR